MKITDITPQTVVYGHQTRFGKPRKAVVLSTAIWTLNTWADRISDAQPFARHENRPGAKYGVTVGALVLTAPVDTDDAELLAAAAAIDVDKVAETGEAPRTERSLGGRSEGVGVEVAMTKDIVPVEDVIELARRAAQDKADSEAETLARRANMGRLRELNELLGLDVPQINSSGTVTLKHREIVALMERIATAEGKS